MSISATSPVLPIRWFAGLFGKRKPKGRDTSLRVRVPEVLPVHLCRDIGIEVDCFQPPITPDPRDVVMMRLRNF